MVEDFNTIKQSLAGKKDQYRELIFILNEKLEELKNILVVTKPEAFQLVQGQAMALQQILELFEPVVVE